MYMSHIKARAVVPRGFSRFYILKLLDEKGPMTGMEIIKEAEMRSKGAWRPSPGLIYPLLGRLLESGLISETKNGKYRLTEGGREALTHYAKIQEEISRRLDVMMMLGSAGKTLIEDSLDRLVAMGFRLREDVAKLSAEARKTILRKYRAFLESELNRVRAE